MVGEPDVVVIVFGGWGRVGGAVKQGEFLVVLEEVGGLALELTMFGHLCGLHEAGGVGEFGVLGCREFFHRIILAEKGGGGDYFWQRGQ